MGEARTDALRLGFDRAIKLEFHGARVSSDTGLFPYRDLDEAAEFGTLPIYVPVSVRESGCCSMGAEPQGGT
jgi:hypothetical protein